MRSGERLCAEKDKSDSFHAHTLIMENTQRKAYINSDQVRSRCGADAVQTVNKGNGATACKLDINESMENAAGRTESM